MARSPYHCAGNRRSSKLVRHGHLSAIAVHIMEKPEFNVVAGTSQITTLQGIISRMGANSASSKTWCISLVAAILVVVADKNKPNYVWIALIPIMLFFFLDAYYLSLERCFIGAYKAFVKHVRDGTATTDDLFEISPQRGALSICTGIGGAFVSVAVWPFYVVLAGTVVVARYLIL